MKYITITGKDYDEAVRRAKTQYGPSLRVHSRRDVVAKGGFLWLGKRSYVEIVCYIPEGKKEEEERPLEEKREHPPLVNPEPIEEEPPKIEPPYEKLLEHAQKILQKNDFSQCFIEEALLRLSQALSERGTELPATEEFELMIVDKIISMVRVDHELHINPPRVFVILGPTGIGKTTTVAKIAALYGLQESPSFRKQVHMITIDSFRIGAFEQISSFGTLLDIPVDTVASEMDMLNAIERAQDATLILIDTIGKSPKEVELSLTMKSLLSVLDPQETRYVVALSATMKEADIDRVLTQYEPFTLSAVIITKTDETESIGNVLSVCYQRDLPLLFFTDGQRVPKDIHKASAATILAKLRGFSLDFTHLWNNQVDTIEYQEERLDSSDQ